MNIYKQAAKVNLSFSTPIGALSVANLWVLPLESKTRANLKAIGRDVNKRIKDTPSEDDIFGDESETDALKLDKLRLEIIKDIVADKIAEREALEAAKKTAETKELMMKIIQEKEFEGLKSKSLDELKKELAAL